MKFYKIDWLPIIALQFYGMYTFFAQQTKGEIARDGGWLSNNSQIEFIHQSQLNVTLGVLVVCTFIVWAILRLSKVE